MTKLDSAVYSSEFKTCIFSKDLTVILETVDDINLDELKTFLDRAEQKQPSFYQFGKCIQIQFDQKEILLRGYKLMNSWIASEMSPIVHTIPFWGNIHELITTFYYFYHMSTCV
jgi:hypothetical protein